MLLEFVLPAGLILALDQVTKKLAVDQLDAGTSYPLPSGPRIRAISKRSVGLGLVRDPRVLLFLWGVAVLGTTLLIRHTALFQGLAARAGLGAALGGATGNLLDTLRRGAVVDFIDLRIWPVFNVADTAIVSGVGVALWSVL